MRQHLRPCHLWHRWWPAGAHRPHRHWPAGSPAPLTRSSSSPGPCLLAATPQACSTFLPRRLPLPTCSAPTLCTPPTPASSSTCSPLSLAAPTTSHTSPIGFAPPSCSPTPRAASCTTQHSYSIQELGLVQDRLRTLQGCTLCSSCSCRLCSHDIDAEELLDVYLATYLEFHDDIDEDQEEFDRILPLLLQAARTLGIHIDDDG